ncbi:hypothetical protein JCM5350_000317 [Sporobolomyces pararoseus]
MANTQVNSIMKMKILLDKHEGGAPDLQRLYRTSESWIRFCRGYQWTQGYDINVSDERKEEYTTLSCSTHSFELLLSDYLVHPPYLLEPLRNSQCTFSITALYQLFNRPGDAPEVFGQYGYRISASEPQDSKPFIPKHSHKPHYVPLNLEQENARRANLQPGDPSLDNPPLIRTRPQRGFASEDTPMPEDVEMRSRATYGGGGAIQNSQAQRDRSSSLVSHIKSEPQHNNTAHVQSPASSSSLYQAPPSYRSTPVHADHYAVPPPPPSRQIQPPPPPTPTPTPSLSVQYQAPVIAPPTPLSTPAPSSIPRTPSVDPSLTQTPLGSFLLEISPSFLEILPNLPSAGLPLSTPPQDLIDVDMDDSIVWDMFQQIEGIKLAHCALAAEGVRKAKLKSQSAAPGARLDPKISGGLEQAKTKAWILRRIAMGEAMAAATPDQSRI